MNRYPQCMPTNPKALTAKKASADLDDDEEAAFEEALSNAVEIHETSVVHRIFSVYISGPIGAPYRFTGLFGLLRSATENDTVIFYLNTPGGQLDTGVQLLNAIRSCRAHVITVLDGEAISMGAILFMAGQERVVQDNTKLMFHTYSGGSFGNAKSNEQASALSANIAHYKGVLQMYTEGFLSKDEILGIMDGKDLWLSAEQVRSRLSKLEKAAAEGSKSSVKTRKSRKPAASVPPPATE